MIQIKNNTGNKYQYFLIGVLIISLVPLLILHYFNQPTPEDFYYSGEAGKIGLMDSMRVLYKFYGGRYFTYLLISLNPLYFHSFTGYKIFTLMLMLLFYFVFFLFVSEFTKSRLNLMERILFSLSVFFFYLFAMPSLSQGFYWLVSAVHYQVALMLIMLFAIYYSRIDNECSIVKRNLTIFITCLITIAIPGTVELSAALMLIIVSLLIMSSIVKDKKISWWLILIALITIVCVYFVIKSPGNDQRSVKYADNHNLFLSLYSSFMFMFQSISSWVFNSPLPVITVLFVPYFFKLTRAGSSEEKSTDVKLLYLIILFLLMLYINIFIIYWSLGIPPYDRILDFIYFIFLVGWFCIIISLTSFITRKYGIEEFKLPNYIYAAAVILIVFFVLRENNITTAYSDLFSGKASEFNRTLFERYDDISKNSSDSLELDSIKNIPQTFFFLDITKDNKRPFNIGYCSYFNKKYIVRKTVIQEK